MPPNPSHLEAVDPVLNGMARAAATDASTQPGAPRCRQGQGARHPDPRRRRVPRPGHRRRDAQPVAARRLRRRRHHPHHRQQPARVHRRSATSRSAPATPAAWRAASRSRSRTSTPTTRWRASKRRGWRSPTAQRFKLDLPDRPRRLPPLRPQRRRRAGVHAAADLPDRRRASDRARAVRARRCRQRRSVAGSRPTRWCASACRVLEQAYAAVKPEQDYVPAGAGGAAERRRAARRAPPCRSTRSQAINADAVEGARRLHRAPQARTRPRAPQGDVRVARRAHDRLGRRRGTGAGVDPRRRRRRSGSPAKTSSAAPSAIATPCYHDAVTGDEHMPLQRAAAGEGGVRDPQQPAVGVRRASASSWATTCRSRTGWCCGKRSTATSSTARRSSSTST